jgi:hypothetical protein
MVVAYHNTHPMNPREPLIKSHIVVFARRFPISTEGRGKPGLAYPVGMVLS